MLAVVGGDLLATMALFEFGGHADWRLFRLGGHGEWRLYAAGAIAAFGAGALMVAHAPLRPWREPAAAGVLAIAPLAAVAFARSDGALYAVLSHLWQPWYVGLGVAVASGALAAAGGIAVRRIATSTPRTALILVLSALVFTGITSLMLMAGYAYMRMAAYGSSDRALLLMMAGAAAGGFVTQAVIAPKRPWACGAGSCALVLYTLTSSDLDGELSVILIVGALLFILIGYGGAQLAWWILRRGDASSSPVIPPARLG
jgi:hypothetical protein